MERSQFAYNYEGRVGGRWGCLYGKAQIYLHCCLLCYVYVAQKVMFSGRHIFLGYFGKENDLVDDEKWLHSGDIGWMDEVSVLLVVIN